MADYQWAPNHNNEANFVDVIGRPTTRGVQYPIYVTAADGSVHPKGAPFVEFEFGNVEITDYLQMLSDLGFTGDPDNTSVDVTVAVPEYDYATFNNWNATCVHRPGVDTDYTPHYYERVRFLFKLLEAT